MLSKSAFPSKTPQKDLTRQLRSLKILIAKVECDEREIFPTALIDLKTSKLSKFSKITKLSKFPNFSKSCQNQTIHATLFFSFLVGP